jgi:hypothetical protein
VDERAFVAGSRSTWERLASSVEDARARGVASLGAERLKRMHEDYRQAAADLAYAQTHFPDSQAADYLNRLVGQAHAELYGATPRRGAALWAFLARGYPRLLRRRWRPLALASAILFGSIALGYLLAHVDYPLARLFLPAAYRDIAGDPVNTFGNISAYSVLRLAPHIECQRFSCRHRHRFSSQFQKLSKPALRGSRRSA